MYAIPPSSGLQYSSNAGPASHLGNESKVVTLVMEAVDVSHLHSTPTANPEIHGPKCSFPENFRRSYQPLHFEGIHPELFYLEQRTLYMWTLDLLYYTLRKAMKFEELTRALLKPFIPSSVVLLFPHRIQ